MSNLVRPLAVLAFLGILVLAQQNPSAAPGAPGKDSHPSVLTPACLDCTSTQYESVSCSQVTPSTTSSTVLTYGSSPTPGSVVTAFTPRHTSIPSWTGSTFQTHATASNASVTSLLTGDPTSTSSNLMSFPSGAVTLTGWPSTTSTFNHSPLYNSSITYVLPTASIVLNPSTTSISATSDTNPSSTTLMDRILAILGAAIGFLTIVIPVCKCLHRRAQRREDNTSSVVHVHFSRRRWWR